MWGRKAAVELSWRLAVILLSPKVNEPGAPGNRHLQRSCLSESTQHLCSHLKAWSRPRGCALDGSSAREEMCHGSSGLLASLLVQHQSDGLLTGSKVYHVPERDKPMVLQGKAWKRILQ